MFDASVFAGGGNRVRPLNLSSGLVTGTNRLRPGHVLAEVPSDISHRPVITLKR
jgi:hypothetical protein